MVKLVILQGQPGHLTKSNCLFDLSQPGHLTRSTWSFNMVNLVIQQVQPVYLT